MHVQWYSELHVQRYSEQHVDGGVPQLYISVHKCMHAYGADCTFVHC